MAGRPRSHKRVRSAAQRQALRKAQLASARKRRRRTATRHAKTGVKVVGSFAGALVAYHANDIARHPSKGKRYYKNAKVGVKKFQHRKHKPTPINLGTPRIPPRRGYNPRYM